MTSSQSSKLSASKSPSCQRWRHAADKGANKRGLRRRVICQEHRAPKMINEDTYRPGWTSKTPRHQCPGTRLPCSRSCDAAGCKQKEREQQPKGGPSRLVRPHLGAVFRHLGHRLGAAPRADNPSNHLAVDLSSWSARVRRRRTSVDALGLPPVLVEVRPHRRGPNKGEPIQKPMRLPSRGFGARRRAKAEQELQVGATEPRRWPPLPRATALRKACAAIPTSRL